MIHFAGVDAALEICLFTGWHGDVFVLKATIGLQCYWLQEVFWCVDDNKRSV